MKTQIITVTVRVRVHYTTQRELRAAMREAAKSARQRRFTASYAGPEGSFSYDTLEDDSRSYRPTAKDVVRSLYPSAVCWQAAGKNWHVSTYGTADNPRGRTLTSGICRTPRVAWADALEAVARSLA